MNSADSCLLPCFAQSEWQSMRMATSSVQDALQRLGMPHHSFRHLLVGGTNGKGTTAAMIAAGWEGSTGLFISPHLETVRERITLAGRLFPDQAWRQAYMQILSHYEEQPPSFSYFEWTLLLAVMMFRNEGVAQAVFEVGLGGRDDATNALDPELSVVTNIGHDHLGLLGPSLEDVVGHKVAIARPGRPIFPPITVANMVSARAYLEKINAKAFTVSGDGHGFDRNETMAEEVLKYLGCEAIQSPSLPGRRQKLDLGCGVYLDGAHNPEAWIDLVIWADSLNVGPFHIVASLSSGRDLQVFLDVIKPISSKIFHFPSGHERALPISDWPLEISDVREVNLKYLLSRPLLVCGSLYQIGPFCRFLKKKAESNQHL